MEENVALDSKKQKKFLKSLKGIKKLLKSEKPKAEKDVTKTVETPIEKRKKKRQKKVQRGLIYISHIPHGFYEKELTEYFNQFGKVTTARVIRSKKTGNSKGYAFVEFVEPSVAQIAAETMNNYLMGKRLLKAVYIPPDQQRKHVFGRKWNSVNNPGSRSRMQKKKAYNADKTEEEELKRAKNILKRLSQTRSKLSELGIDYSFFKPVDVPEGLMDEHE